MSDKIFLKDITLPIVETGKEETYSFVQTDSDLETAGDAADAKKTGDEITQLKADLTDMDGKIAATQITNTASGAIASFEDGADGVPVKDMTVQIEPVQDLHGMDSPYPAGASKNIFNPDTANPTQNYVIGEDGSLSSNNYYDTTDYITLTPNTAYAFSGYSNNDAGSLYVGQYDSSKAFISRTILSNYSNGRYSGTITTDANCAYIRISLPKPSGSSVDFTLMQIELGSTVTDFAYYSNICPIRGWTGANVHISNKNMAFADGRFVKTLQGNPCTYSDGVIATSPGTYTCGMLYPIKPGYRYYIKLNRTTGSTTYRRFTTYTDIPSSVNDPYFRHISTVKVTSNGVVGNYFDAVEGENYVFIGMYRSSQADAFTITDFSLSIEGYLEDGYANVGTYYPIIFPTEAGTVYSGKINPITGELTVDHALVEVNSDTVKASFAANNAGRYRANYSLTALGKPVAASGCTAAQLKSNALATANSSNIVNYGGAYTIGCHPNGGSIYITLTAEEDTADKFNDYLDTIGTVQLLYPLAEPQTYQLDPVTIATLLGQNNIWADCGDTTVDYRADTKLYIEKLTAPTEDDMVANTNIPSDTYFMIGNTLYLSTTTIPAGDTINPGTNCTKMDLAAALNAINA